MDNIIIRLNILANNKIIDQDTLDKTIKIHKLLKFYEINHENSEQYDMFITHIAMMMQRLKNNISVNATIDDDIYKDIKDCVSYKKASNILERIENTVITKIPEVEKRFLLLHLCNLLERSYCK